MLSDTELDINGTKLKGVWIAIVLTIGTSVGGTVWTASSLYSRLEAVETREIPDTTEIQTNLVELGTNLKTIMENQAQLVTLKDEVKEMRVIVDKAEIATKDADKISDKLEKQEKEIQSLWEGLDYLANPLRSE
tara:strand:- start:451 stop:852 length:402 start_codon:yes stop_codon:yes gene_type:complete